MKLKKAINEYLPYALIVSLFLVGAYFDGFCLLSLFMFGLLLSEGPIFDFIGKIMLLLRMADSKQIEHDDNNN